MPRRGRAVPRRKPPTKGKPRGGGYTIRRRRSPFRGRTLPASRRRVLPKGRLGRRAPPGRRVLPKGRKPPVRLIRRRPRLIRRRPKSGKVIGMENQ